MRKPYANLGILACQINRTIIIIWQRGLYFHDHTFAQLVAYETVNLNVRFILCACSCGASSRRTSTRFLHSSRSGRRGGAFLCDHVNSCVGRCCCHFVHPVQDSERKQPTPKTCSVLQRCQIPGHRPEDIAADTRTVSFCFFFVVAIDVFAVYKTPLRESRLCHHQIIVPGQGWTLNI